MNIRLMPAVLVVLVWGCVVSRRSSDSPHCWPRCARLQWVEDSNKPGLEPCTNTGDASCAYWFKSLDPRWDFVGSNYDHPRGTKW